MRHSFLFTIVLLPILTACVVPAEDDDTVLLDLDNSDATYRQIISLQNERDEEALLVYLASDTATHRYLAARAFGSFPEIGKAARDSLISRLNDPAREVRLIAAYALGQSGLPVVSPALTAAFDRSGSQLDVNAAILQAAGKTADRTMAEQLAAITTYSAKDTLLSAARAWGIFYAALRGHRSASSDAVMVDLINDRTYDLSTRYPAAYYLQRIVVDIDPDRVSELETTLRTTTDAVIAMGILRALGHSGKPSARLALLTRLERNKDWRERVEIIHALAGFDYATVRESILDLIRDRHPLVSRTAADFLVAHGAESDAPLYVRLAEDPALADRSIALYRAANRHLSPYLNDYRDHLIASLKRKYASTTDAYERAEVILALAEFPWNYRLLMSYYQDAGLPVVRTAIVEGLRLIGNRDDFDTYFAKTGTRVRSELAMFFRERILEREEGPAYQAAAALRSGAATFRTNYSDLGWLDTSLTGFALPRQIETYTEVFNAANALKGVDLPLPAQASPKLSPADWALLEKYGDRMVKLELPDGTVNVRLYPTLAPATVSSFIKLVRQGYYDNKVFHRVVPNFVAQGGGPRGDGFGSENFILPTETPPIHYDRAGLLGMASAGKDTEGVQFYITHRPTPHLDGKYTIFGEVVSGQEVVDLLVPGSRITKIHID